MTIDKAIELLTHHILQDFRNTDSDLADAVKLGIEALKWRKHLEDFDQALRNHPLPGETEP